MSETVAISFVSVPEVDFFFFLFFLCSFGVTVNAEAGMTVHSQR